MSPRRGPTAAAGSAPAVVLDAVSVRFGRLDALRDVSLQIAPGSYHEVRGRNGSGKTTLLRVLAGTCAPSAGRRHGVRGAAFVPAALEPPALSVRAWTATVRPHRRPVAEALEVLGFEGELGRSFRRLSFGNVRKVLLADALCSTASLVVLDEARAGLDGRGLAGLQALVADARRDGAAVVIADQVAHPVPAGAIALQVLDGGVRPTVDGAEDVTTAAVVLRGPIDRLTDLERQAAALGFRRDDDG